MSVQPGTRIDDLDTPSLLVDLDVMEANIAAMAAIAREGDTALRPHVKSHKTPALAWQQIQAGATGITCQKLGEAEVMADAGITDILVPYPIVGPIKIARLLSLAARIHITTIVDSLAGARAISEAAAARGQTIDTLLEVDVGFRRCGVQPDAVAPLATAITHECPGLRFKGLLAYEGHVYSLADPEAVTREARRAFDTLGEVASCLRALDVAVECVSTGATATARVAAAHPAVTEIRAGSYIFNDLTIVASGGASEQECALTVLTTVVSLPTRERAIVDAGSKALTFATAPGRSGYGAIRSHEDLTLEWLADEHGIVAVPRDAHPLRLGERVRVIPNSHTGVVNQFSELIGVRSDRVECVWPIAARGRMQ